jgi:hypothetical protein
MAARKPTGQEMARKVRAAELKGLMGDVRFRNFVLRLLANASIFHTTHRAEPVQSAFAEGRRALGLEVLHELLRADAGGVRTIFPDDAALLAAIGPQIPQTPGDDDGPDERDFPFER